MWVNEYSALFGTLTNSRPGAMIALLLIPPIGCAHLDRFPGKRDAQLLSCIALFAQLAGPALDAGKRGGRPGPPIR